ncbi:MAG: hypothetical protein QOF78_4462 [Phycisphaerales bacterium]|nr:hypothetical protein [Phycisphaerales bacterium]
MTIDQTIDYAVTLGMHGRLRDAEEILRRIVSTDPANARAYANFAVALQMQDKFDEALDAVRRSLALRAESPPTHLTHAKVLMRLARPVEAAAACRAALRGTPDDAEAHGMLGRALLQSGDYKHGWIEYEWRWKCASFEADRGPISKPRWTGGRIAGQKILLHHEQGFGDTIQFIRYAPLLAERGAAVFVQSPPELADLIRRMPSVASVNPPVALAETIDCHLPLMSLPLACNTTLKTIPANVPYLAPDAKQIDAWRARVLNDGPARLRVGISWAGSALHNEDRFRTMRLEQFAPMARAAGDGVVFYSLQKCDADQQAAHPPAGMRLIDCGPKIFDFSDAAALIANLDLVITVDTAVAHLAGAMGRPVWVMLPFAPDFRWLLDREDSPWYPTMRLLRQQRLRDWSGPVHIAGERLHDLASRGVR